MSAINFLENLNASYGKFTTPSFYEFSNDSNIDGVELILNFIIVH